MAATFIMLVVSAAACEGVGGPSPDPPSQSTQGSGNDPGAPEISKLNCGDVVNCATGDETTEQIDDAIGGRGLGLNIVRSYDSQASAAAQAESKSVGLWGWGWTGPYSASLEFGTESGQNTVTVQQQNGSAITFYENKEEAEHKGEYEQAAWVQARLVKEGSNYIYTLPTQAKLEFNGEGRLVKETDRDGNATTLTYNGSKQLEKVTDATGRTLTFKYNGEGHVESIKDPLGHVVSYTYVAKGGLSSVSIEGKVRWEYGYTATAPYLLSSVTDGRGHTTTREYDASHRVIKETVAGHERKWSYGTNETTLTEPNGAESVYTFNTASEPTKVIEAKGTGSEKVTEYEYSGTTFELTKLTDPNKHVTEYAYDSEGNRTSAKDPNGDEHKWEYDKKHNIVKETSPEGETTTIKRNANGDPEVIERPIGAETQKTEYKYDAYGELTEVIDPLGNKTKYTYDSHGDRETETDAEGNEHKWKYNEDSQATEETDPRGYKTKIELNNYGLPTKITDPLGHTTEYKYDANQNIESETDGNKHTTKYEYNEENLPIKITKPNGDTTKTGYDAEGKKTSYTDGNSHTWEYKRNLLEQVTEEKNPLGKIWKKTYGKAGTIEKLEDPEKHTTEYTYDETNRLTKIKYSTGKPGEVTYKYNKDSKVTEMKDETGTTENTYDKLDRLTQYKNGAGKTVKYEYNLDNLQAAITYPNGKEVKREYDKENRLAKVTDWKGHATTFKYNADSMQTATIFQSATEDKDEYAYNEADQMSEVDMYRKGSVVAGAIYERDADGQVIKSTEKFAEGLEPETISHVLDENNRIIEYNKHAYTYDKANNPTEIEGEAGYTYNEADQLKESPTAKYKYNEDGDRTKLEPKNGEPATTYTYDQAGHLTSTERAKGTKQTELTENATYDGAGLEQAATTNGTKYKVAWDTAEPLPIILEDENSAGEEASYIYGPENLPIEETFGVNAINYHHDQQGSTRLITYEEEGSVVGWKTYGPFGNTIETAGDATPLGYDGQPTDTETGIAWLGARRYDTTTGQFLTNDPALLLTGEPYSYTADNPENMADPSGWCASGDDTTTPLNTVPAKMDTVHITADAPPNVGQSLLAGISMLPMLWSAAIIESVEQSSQSMWQAVLDAAAQQTAPTFGDYDYTTDAAQSALQSMMKSELTGEPWAPDFFRDQIKSSGIDAGEVLYFWWTGRDQQH
ncbi:MAG TPA: RHS repeat-associated core domain-containing protein [Solirubrobacteraceae bacterium]|jgi:RHS repeat-associated protein